MIRLQESLQTSVVTQMIIVTADQASLGMVMSQQRILVVWRHILSFRRWLKLNGMLRGS